MAVTIPITTKYDGKGFDQAARDAKRLEQESIRATKNQIAEHRKVTQLTAKLDKDLAAERAKQTQQLKDWGAAALTAGGILVAVGVQAVGAAKESAAAEAQLVATIESTGGAAGQSLEALKAHAAALQDISLFSDEAVMDGQGLLLTFTNIKETFPDATQTMLDMSTALDQDLSSSAMQLGKALNDPIKGISALTRVGVTFTDEQKKMIEAMVESGDIAGAQRIILAELNREFGGSAAAAREAAGGQADLNVAQGEFEESLGRLLEKIGDAGVTGALVTLFDKLATGAEAWIPVIDNVKLLSGAMNILKKDSNSLEIQLSEMTGGLSDVIKILGDISTFGLGNIAEFAGAYFFNQDNLQTAVNQQQRQTTTPTPAPVRSTPAPTTPNSRIPGARGPIGNFATGGAFTVPPGFPNDSFTMGVSSGERVTVQPQGQGGGNITVNVNGIGGADLATIIRRKVEDGIREYHDTIITPWSNGN